MKNFEEIIGEYLASDDHSNQRNHAIYGPMGDDSNQVELIRDKKNPTKEDITTLISLYYNTIKIAFGAYDRGLFDALKLIPGHGLTEEGLKETIQAKMKERKRVNVILKEAGTEKIKVIKTVREFTDLSLKEAKDVVEGVPSLIMEDISKDDAIAIAAKFKEVGAVVTIELV